SIPALVAHAGNVDSLVTVYRITGVEPERGLYGSQAFPASDGYVLIANPMAERFPNACRAIGLPGLVDDPRFATPESRARYGQEFHALLLEWCLARTAREAFVALQAESVLASVAYSPGALL